MRENVPMPHRLQSKENSKPLYRLSLLSSSVDEQFPIEKKVIKETCEIALKSESQ